MENEFHSASRHISPAPGAPGHCSPWTSGAKTGIGRALDGGSEVSFTVCKGILNEVYFPREDIACIRECGVIITDEANFYSDERTDTRQKERTVEPGVPAYLLENSHNNYRISKEIITDPCRDTVLQHLRFRSNRSGLHFFST